MTRVGLTMIVRNEHHIIHRALTAAAPWIDFYTIHDTGSTDGTPDTIAQAAAELGLPGQVTHGEFHDFAQARNEGLDHARRYAPAHERADDGPVWLLLADADMTLDVTDPDWRNHLHPDTDTAAAFGVMWHAGDLAYPQPRLIRNDTPATYLGVTHEYLDVDTSAGPVATIPGLRFIEHSDSGTRPEKFTRDLRLLTAQVDTDPDDARARFYLAQTHRDLGHHQTAIDHYQHRAQMGGWQQEVFYSLHQIAVLTERLGVEGAHVADRYLDAHAADPTRPEPLIDLARLERTRGRYAVGLLYARAATTLPTPAPDTLFADTAAQWRAWDERAICAWWAGHHDEALAAAQTAYDTNPAEPRLAENLRLCTA